MADVRALVESLDGYAHKSQLVARGARDIDLTRAVRAGDVVRLRRGWYTSRDPSSPASQAVSIGGRLTGISAIIEWGGWVLGARKLHVSVRENAARLRPTGRSVRLHWDSVGHDRGTATVVSLADALFRVVLDEDVETAVAALDWALHTGRLDRIDFERLVILLPANKRYVASFVDRRCESLPESLTRTRLTLAGHRVTSQVPLDIGRIDLVIDGVIGLETDGEEYHRDSFESDRRKDLAIVMAGYRPIRASARMVFYEWDLVLGAVEMLLHSRGVHGASTISARA